MFAAKPVGALVTALQLGSLMCKLMRRITETPQNVWDHSSVVPVDTNSDLGRQTAPRVAHRPDTGRTRLSSISGKNAYGRAVRFERQWSHPYLRQTILFEPLMPGLVLAGCGRMALLC